MLLWWPDEELPRGCCYKPEEDEHENNDDDDVDDDDGDGYEHDDFTLVRSQRSRLRTCKEP